MIDRLRMLIDAIVGTGTTGERRARLAYYSLVVSSVMGVHHKWSPEGWAIVLGVILGAYGISRTVDGKTGATGGKSPNQPVPQGGANDRESDP